MARIHGRKTRNRKDRPMSKHPWRELMTDPSMPRPMREQLEQMKINAEKWKAEHPDAVLFYNFPEAGEFVVVGAIDEAVEAGVVRANGAAIALFQAMWPWHVQTAPTLNMVRWTLERVFGEEP